MKKWLLFLASLYLFTANAWATCNLTLRNSLQSCYVGTRLYEVLVPSLYASNGSMLIAYHGKGDTAANFSSTSGLITTAKK
jgi:poly(3-hydroxybutyrate) depolymerase